MTNRLGLAALVLFLEAAPALAQSPQTCDGLQSLALANTAVTTAAVVSGSFTPPGATNPNATRVDYGYRAVHEMTVAAKTIVRAFYGDGPRYSYWNGCSTGGRQGLMEAQRYPADYDGIIGGAPVNARVHQLIWELWVAQAVHHDDTSYIPPAKYRLLNDAALAKCDASDGAKDGLLTSPDRCIVDPVALQCTGDDVSSCLTAAQVAAAKKIDGSKKARRRRRSSLSTRPTESSLAAAHCVRIRR